MPVSGWKRLPEVVESVFRAPGEDGEKRLAKRPRALEDLPRAVRRPSGAPHESPLLPGGEDAALPRPGGEVGIGLEKLPNPLRRPLLYGIDEVETESPPTQLENPRARHRKVP